MISNFLNKILNLGRQLTLGDLMNIDEGRMRRSLGCTVIQSKVYHEVRQENISSKIKSWFFGKSYIPVHYIIIKVSVKSDSGKIHEVIVRMDPDYNLNNWMNNRVKVYCDCSDFKYRSAYLLGKSNSLFLNDRIKIALGAAVTDSPRSSNVSTLCKHSFAAISWILDNYQTLMKTI